MKSLHIQKIIRVSLILLIIASSLEGFFPVSVNATNPSAYIRLDRLGINATGGGLVCETAQGAGTEAHVVVTFPGNGTAGAASFGVNSTAANWTVTTTNLPSGTTAWPGIGTATTVSGAVVTFPSTDLTPGTTYCFNFASASTLTNPSSTGSGNTLTGTVVTQTSAPATIDSTTYALAIVGATADQILVTASVPQSFTFALGSNTAALGTLTLGSVVSATAITATTTTNAANGYTIWIKSANAALDSAGTGGTIATSGTYPTTTDLSSTSKGYGANTANSSGNVTADAGYSGGANIVGQLATTYNPIGSYTGPSIAAGDVLNITIRAKADTTVKAASDYTDTLTVSAAGKF